MIANFGLFLSGLIILIFIVLTILFIFNIFLKRAILIFLLFSSELDIFISISQIFIYSLTCLCNIFLSLIHRWTDIFFNRLEINKNTRVVWYLLYWVYKSLGNLFYLKILCIIGFNLLVLLVLNWHFAVFVYLSK